MKENRQIFVVQRLVSPPPPRFETVRKKARFPGFDHNLQSFFGKNRKNEVNLEFFLLCHRKVCIALLA